MLRKARNEQNYLKYNRTQDYIQFWLTPPDYNSEAEILLKDFLLQISEKANNYAHFYRLPVEDEKIILEPSAIALRQHDTADYFNSFFRLYKVEINLQALEYACETAFYIGCKDQNMDLFFKENLTIPPTRLIASGEVDACFMSVDQGADYWSIINSKYVERVQALFQSLEAAGYRISESKKLRLP